MTPNEVICGTCGAETDGPPATGCHACGAPLRVLEPMVTDCGWCGRSNHREQTAHCVACGGPLPALPGGEPGPRPPDVPRALPDGYAQRVRLWKNVLVMLGLMFTLVFFWTVVFPLIGLPMLWWGNRKATDQLDALVGGRGTRGRIVKVAKDPSQSINGRNPWRIDFAYDLHDGSSAAAWCHAWDPISADRHAGDAVWVVYGERDGRRTAAIWPPLR
jgi:hypothetical protein